MQIPFSSGLLEHVPEGRLPPHHTVAAAHSRNVCTISIKDTISARQQKGVIPLSELYQQTLRGQSPNGQTLITSHFTQPFLHIGSPEAWQVGQIPLFKAPRGHGPLIHFPLLLPSSMWLPPPLPCSQCSLTHAHIASWSLLETDPERKERRGWTARL